MKRDELLDKLAMDLPQWPDVACHSAHRLCGTPKDCLWEFSQYGWSLLVIMEEREKIIKQDWIQRRKELINCPPDSDAPEWAAWKAQDADGTWSWFEAKPSGTDSNIWMMEDEGYVALACEGAIPSGHNWRDTLTPIKRNTDECTPEEERPWCELESCLSVAKQCPAQHYRHEYRGIKLDPYRIAKVYNMKGGPREQILKKVLRFTDKGHTEQQVIIEVRSALNRWQEMLDEDSEGDIKEHGG